MYKDSDSDDEIANRTATVLVLSENSQQVASTKGKEEAAGSTMKPWKM